MMQYLDRSFLFACRVGQIAGIIALGSIVGAAGAAGDPPAEKPTAPAEAAVPLASEQDPAVDEAVELARERFIQGQMDLWLHLFGKEVGEHPPMLTLDFRTDKAGLFPGASEEGDAFTLVALEVTPIPVDDGSLAPFVSAEDLTEFKELQGDASLIFGLMTTDRGSRAVLGASATTRNKQGGTDTVFVPLVVAQGGETCPPPSRLKWPTFDTPAGGGSADERTWGYCRCVLQILKCELYTAGCIAAVPAAIPACAGVCAGTAGIGCVSCIIAAAAGTVAICEAAYDCWVRAAEKGCV